MYSMILEDVNGLEAAGQDTGDRKVGLDLTDFLSRLAETTEVMDWHVTRRGQIRAQLKKSRNGMTFSPITALAYVVDGIYYTDDEWSTAAEHLGLSLQDRADLHVASQYAWDPSCRQGRLRQQLLEELFVPKTGTRFLLHALGNGRAVHEANL